MREIKFRAWDRERKQMGVVDQMTCSPTLAGWRPHPDNRNWSIHLVDGENADFMQFTGLKDKNGKEIYESDLLKWESDVYIVRYLSGEWILWHSGDPDNDRPSLANIIKPSGLNVEVIGNEFESPASV